MRWSNDFKKSKAITTKDTKDHEGKDPKGLTMPVGQARACVLAILIAALVLCATVVLSAPPEQKRVSIYSTAANYSLSVLDRDHRDYVSLLEVLEPLGTVTAKVDRSRWKFRYNNVDAEFNPGKNRVRIQGHDVDLPANFLLESGRGLVPLDSLTILLPRFLGGPVTFNVTARRLFIGNVSVHFTAHVNKENPPTLVMDFSSPVNPMIATEPGKVRMVFTHEPIVPPGSQTLTFDSKTIPSASYQEDNGAVEITVNGSVPLFASFSNDGRTITVTAAPQTAAQVAARTPQPQLNLPAITSPTQSATYPPSVSSSGSPTYFAVVDASHGGEERGAALSDQLSEKDVTLAFARKLRQELESRSVSVLVLRDGEATLSLDQRANLANAAHPAIYICIHAASQGTGIRLYGSMLPPAGESRGPFLDWDTAQSAFAAVSQIVEASLIAELQKKQISVRTLIAPLRPLNNITAAAVAVEIAPPEAGISEINSPGYQQLITETIATGIVAAREKLEAPR
jgi:N-acetylmuramoyl-L-alanine amidase